MKAVMISIRPEWVAKIATGEKTIEIRKSRPTTIRTPFKCYIYCTGGKPLYIWESPYCKEHKRVLRFSEDGKSVSFRNGTQINKRVIGEFICDSILRHCEMANADFANVNGLLTLKEIDRYSENHTIELFGWHIFNLVIYDQPKDITEFVQCHKCEYYAYCRDRELSCDGSYVLRRPPQSWCYVEELRDA